jgi:dUTP pyrophosphatase
VSDTISVKIKKLKDKLEIPAYATNASAGVDLQADISEPCIVNPGEKIKIPTGLAMELPDSQVVALVFARSGLASRFGVSLTNGVGVIDSDYRGEIQVLLQNLGEQSITINPGDRIAQMLFMPVYRAIFEEVAELSETDRGSGGFGSTGL